MATNSLLSAIMGDVYLLTKRPDLVDATRLAVKNATLRLHMTDFYHKDLFETGISFDVANYIHKLSIKELLPTFRAVHYLRKVAVDYSATSGYVGTDFLEAVHPLYTKDDYGIDRLDVYYSAGQVINIRLSTSEDKLLGGFYLYPNLSDESYESWIAREVKEAIVYDAAATVMKGIGFDEQAAQFRADTQLWMRLLKNNNLDSGAF